MANATLSWRKDSGSVIIPKTSALIAQQIRTAIVKGALNEDDMLPTEQELMAKFQVSRPTLREAMRILETENLVAVIRGPRGGARIIKPSANHFSHVLKIYLGTRETKFSDILNAQLLLEDSAICSLSVPTAVRPMLVHLGEALAESGGKDLQGPVSTIRKIGGEILSLSGNQVLQLMWRSLEDLMEEVMSGGRYGLSRDELFSSDELFEVDRICARISLISKANCLDRFRTFWSDDLGKLRRLAQCKAQDSQVLELFD